MQSGSFVILEHRTGQEVHWDLMLQWGDVLRTWSLSRPPEVGQTISARALPDHRIHFLDYEGPISQDRGHVTQWDRGTYKLLDESARALTAELLGKQVAGRITLCRKDEAGAPWSFQFEG